MDKLHKSLASLSLTTSQLIVLQVRQVENYSQYNDRIYMNVYDMKRNKLSALDFLLLDQSHLYRCWPDLECKLEGSAIVNDPLNEKFDCKVIRQQDLLALPSALDVTIAVLDSNREKMESSDRIVIERYANEYLLQLGFVFEGQQFRVDCPGKLKATVCVECIQSDQDRKPDSRYFKYRVGTKIHFKSLVLSQVKQKLEVGGLEQQISQIVELIRLPNLLESHGISLQSSLLAPPKGILLYGPPGTGKTLLAKKIANDLDYAFFPIDGSDISSKYFGETEERLIKIFDEAVRASPSIVFIDELDCLCPKREESQSSVERRTVACLLTLMDGINTKSNVYKDTVAGADNVEDLSHNLDTTLTVSKAPIDVLKNVFVIAATNRPDSLDSALRRPGRFDKEIEIPIPNAANRRDILDKIIFNAIPKDNMDLTESDIAFVAERAHGYVGADLSALCKAALLNCVHRCSEIPIAELSTELSCSELVAKSERNFKLTRQDLLHGLTVVRPSAMREITAQIPSVRWEDIGGQEETKQALRECVEWPLLHRDSFQRMGIEPPKGVLLYGPPGCSKTLMAKALATEAKLNFIPIKGPELFNKWVGESERAVKEVFRKARAASPSIIFFDEIDAIATKRDSSGTGENTVQDRVLSMLLNEMDGIEPLVNVTIVGATNRPDAMDAALLRPGRFDRLIYVRPPDAKARLEIFRIQAKKMPFASEVDFSQLVAKSEGYSGAELVSLCQEAAINALARAIDAQVVEMTDFDVAFGKVRKGITTEMIEFYEHFHQP